MTALDVVLVCVALPGHIALWIGRSNALHATGLPEWFVRIASALCHAANLSGIFIAAAWFYTGGSLTDASIPWTPGRVAAWCYVVACLVVLAGPVRVWFYHRFIARRPAALLSDEAIKIDVARFLGRVPARTSRGKIALRLPLNEALRLSVHEKTIALPRLPAALDGLSIAHLSDFHAGHSIDKDFFTFVVDRANEMQADLVCITGDLLETKLAYEWIDDIFARLTAPHGVYFVLGNHDAYLHDSENLRDKLTAASLVDLGGRWLETNIRGERIVLAGNELPWFAPAAADLAKASPRDASGGPFRIVLAHAPDQLAWAQRHDVDLLLAGHTHGGQIRLPIIGPVLVPSRLDVHYSAGLFDEPPTIMHVSRGISGKTPIRFNCPPEITKLVLRQTKEHIG